MKRKLRLFTGAFVVTAILIAALCGFAAVDLSAERYMPGSFAPMLQLHRLDQNGLDLAFMGQRHVLPTAYLSQVEEFLRQHIYLLPPETLWLSLFAEYGYNEAMDFINGWRAGEPER